MSNAPAIARVCIYDGRGRETKVLDTYVTRQSAIYSTKYRGGERDVSATGHTEEEISHSRMQRR